jgi:hypothetical protein
MSEHSSSHASTTEPARSWGLAWDLCALVLPLLAMAPLVRLEVEAVAGRTERWFAGLIPPFVLLAMLLVFRNKTTATPDEDEEGGFFKAIKLAITGTAQTKPLLDRPAGPPQISRARWAVSTVCGSLLLFIISVLWSAPWLATVAAIGAFGGWALGRMTRVHWPAIAAWCALLLVALPLPGWWELGLVRWMQWIAGLLAAGVLDLLRVPNLRYGNLFELKGFLLNIEAALRGPFSFYALAGLAAITMYLRGNGLTTTLVKFLTLPLWGILLYTARLLIILLAQHWYGRDLTQGNDFLLVSAASFAWAYLAYLLWDLLLSTMLGPVPPEVPELAEQYNRLNRFLCWPNEVPIDDITPSLAFERSEGSRAVETTETKLREKTIATWWRLPGLAVPLVGLLLAAGFASVTVAAVTLRGSGSISTALPELSSEQLALLPSKETLSETVDSWLRVGYRRDEVEAIERVGPETRAWDYRSGNRLATFRADLPTRGWSDLVHWYAQRGWELEEMVVVPGKLNPNWPWIEMTLVNSYGIKARICHSVFTANGKPYLDSPAAKPIKLPDIGEVPKQPLSDKLRQLAGEAAPLTIQIQLFSDTLDVGKKLDLAEFRKLYEQLREKLIQDQAQRSWTFGFEK